MPKLLFVSHDANRTGAPILLLNLAKLLQETPGFEIHFLLLQDGPLASEFATAGKTHTLYKTPLRIRDRVMARIHKAYATNLSKFDWSEYDLVLVNTVASLHLLPLLRQKFNGTIVSYLHELKAIKDYFLTAEKFTGLASLVNFFLAPCIAVKDFLVSESGIPAPKVGVLPYYIPPVAGASRHHQPNAKKTFVAGGCGTVDFRKGTDLFIQVAYRFKRTHSDLPVKFIWKGAKASALEYKMLLEDVVKLNLSDTVSFQPSSGDMTEFYKSLDLLLLTSREDAYPLVILEAANATVPAVCFEKAGGAAEFIGQDAGTVVPYLSVEQMADAVYDYYQHGEKIQTEGACAFQKLKTLHQDKEAIGKKFLALMKEATDGV